MLKDMSLVQTGPEVEEATTQVPLLPSSAASTVSAVESIQRRLSEQSAAAKLYAESICAVAAARAHLSGTRLDGAEQAMDVMAQMLHQTNCVLADLSLEYREALENLAD